VGGGDLALLVFVCGISVGGKTKCAKVGGAALFS